eukprot:m.184371 g.184371  ORF g.184371 m.184371 type:complete len:83 (+) comp39318_c4_seq31:5055-5303(+)
MLMALKYTSGSSTTTDTELMDVCLGCQQPEAGIYKGLAKYRDPTSSSRPFSHSRPRNRIANADFAKAFPARNSGLLSLATTN